jgi:hypothetical protein
MMCGEKQLDMLQVCLDSIYRHFSELPHILLFTDLNTDTSHFKKTLKRFPANNIQIVCGHDCLSYHRAEGKKSLVSFAEKNPMGLKLAAVLQAIESGKPVLYCDTDVIWYDDPCKIVKQYINEQDFDLAMSEDFQPAYDRNLVNNAGLDKLYNSPYLCAGIMLIKCLSKRSSDTLGRLVNKVTERSNHFSEQTIFAFLNRESNNITLDKEKFLIQTDDQYKLFAKATPGVIARHYIGPVRHLFWRDALWLK